MVEKYQTRYCVFLLIVEIKSQNEQEILISLQRRFEGRCRWGIFKGIEFFKPILRLIAIYNEIITVYGYLVIP